MFGIFGVNLSPANKKFFSISIILYLLLTCLILLKQKRPTKGNLPEGILIPELLNNPLASYSLKDFYFLLRHTSYFDKSIILPFFVLTTFGFLLYVFFLHFKQDDSIVL